LVAALKDLDSAFRNFFRKLKKGDKSKGYPKFKPYNNSVRYHNRTVKYSAEKHRIWLSKTGWMIVKDYETAIGKVMNATVSHSKDDRWYISICVEQQLDEYVNKSNSEIGIDMGIKDFLIDSNGTKIKNPKFYVTSQKKRRRLQRELSKKQKGSNNRKKAKLKLAKFDAKVAAQRQDFLHQRTTELTKSNSLIVHEDLNIKGMMKNRNLSKHIQDVSWGDFFRMLEYKGNWYNCDIRTIDRFYPSSKKCYICGHGNNSLRLNDREWVCSECGSSLDRDVNAAKNILNEGLKQ
jgi:putative transposase